MTDLSLRARAITDELRKEVPHLVTDHLIFFGAMELKIEAALKRVADTSTNTLSHWMIEQGYATGHGETIEDLLKELEWQIKDRGDRLAIRYREALEWYAKVNGKHIAMSDHPGMRCLQCDFEADNGNRARQALGPQLKGGVDE